MSVATKFLTSSYVFDANKSAFTLAPKMLQKPRVILLWLITARRAQIALIVIALTMPSFAPNTVHGLYNKISPLPNPLEVVEQIPYFFQHLQGNSGLEKKFADRKVVIRTALWLSSGTLMVLLLWLHIPKAVNLASRLARELEEEADNLLNTKPFKSIVLYKSALSLSVYANHENSLNEKIAGTNQLSDAFQSLDTIVSCPSSSQSSHWQQAAFFVLDSQERPNTAGPASRYRMKNLLGKGAMGYVYLAHDTVLDRDVAIKQLSPQFCHDEQFIGRFKQEAKALAKLSHPNIVHVHDFIKDCDKTWIVMEYIEGKELSEKLIPGKAMPFELAVKLAIEMSQVMQYAHDRGVVHRDFKPANVLVTPENLAKIMDFGLAKFNQSAGSTQVGTIMGSPAFMSPEQAAGKPVDSRTDIYALGVTLYVMFSGVTPFNGDLRSVISQHLTAVPKPPRTHNKGIPEALEKTILQMMSKHPDDRPASMSEIFDTFQSIQKNKVA